MTPAVSTMLRAATHSAWFELAARRWHDLLLDHANCEKKAASTALSLMFSYPQDTELTGGLSRVAREELRHFERLQQMMLDRGVEFRRLSPSRYAEGLRRAIRRSEPARCVDLLLCAALIEARSHERFVGLVDRLPAPLGDFYASLAVAESRHASLYLRLAERRSTQASGRLDELAAVEADLATSPDPEFRFHSGTPV